MNVMSRFTLRSMRANRKWTVVTLIGIVISTAMIAAISTLCTSFLELMRNETIATGGNWHAAVSGVRMEDVWVFENAGFVKEITFSRDVGYAVLAGSRNAYKPYLFIRQFDEGAGMTFSTELLAGRMPVDDGELVLPQHLETNGGVKYEVGDTLTLDIGRRTNPRGLSLAAQAAYQEDVVNEDGSLSRGELFIPEQTRTYTVVGIVKRPNFEPLWASGYTALTHLDTDTLGPDDTVIVTLLAKRLSRSLYHDMAALVESAGLDESHINYHSELLRYSGIVADDRPQNMIYGFAAVFIVIIMIASVSLIYNAFAISISERVSQLGMLASVGATRQQKRRGIIFEGLLLGIAGIPTGILAGIGGIGVTLSAVRPLMESFLASSEGLVLHVSPLSVVAAAVLATLTILISVWIPARHASSTMPIDAIRQSKEVKLTPKTVKTSPLTRALYGFEGEIALKNLKRSRKKYRATVLSLIISLVLFLTASYYAQELSRASSAVETGYNFDLMVTYRGVARTEVRGVNERIAALEGVTASTEMEQTAAAVFFSAEKGQVSDLIRRIYLPDGQENLLLSARLYCLDDASFDRYVRSLGADPQDYRNPDHPRVIVINYGSGFHNGKRTAGEILSMPPGSRLTITRDPSAADGTDDSLELEAGLLTDQRPMGVLISLLNEISLVVSREVFDSLPDSLKDMDSVETLNYQQLFLASENTDALETQIQEMTRDVYGKAYVSNVAANARNERNLMLVLGVFIYGFISLISLICIANILNTVTTNVALRRREFAMLRSVGMTPKSFRRMIRFESIFYGLRALLYGLPISFAVALLLHRLQSDVFDVGFSLPWSSYGVAVLLILIIVATTMLYSSAKTERESIIDALKAETM